MSNKQKVKELLVKNGLEESYQILERVPEYSQTNTLKGIDYDCLITIIDVETTGLDAKKDKLTEIGIIRFAVSAEFNNMVVIDSYQELNDPGVAISEGITKLTGITQEMVKGHTIDWDHVSNILVGSDIILCHNAKFDSAFLKAANNELFGKMKFACTKEDVDWQERGILRNNLDYINWKLGYFYNTHRAINDCWATLNLIVQSPGALLDILTKHKVGV